MDIHTTDDAVTRRIKALTDQASGLKENGLYFYNQPVQEMLPGMKVRVNGREMGMYASYSYLRLVGHPRINEAAKKAVDKFGTGTHGVRSLAGTLTIHSELEETISNFKHTLCYVQPVADKKKVISTGIHDTKVPFLLSFNHTISLRVPLPFLHEAV